MNKIKKISIALVLMTIIAVVAGIGTTAATTNDQHPNLIAEQVTGGDKADLTTEEINGLIKMREEEKLARDVYEELYDKWGLNIFKNIASSEQTHTDAIKYLLDEYGIEDPVTNDERGVFASQEMTDLYNTLTEKGKESLLEALKVGATVEDLDIKDLEDLLESTENKDIKLVYQNLRKGSRNHLRSFYQQIEQNGGTYEAQYISAEELSEIVNSEPERGVLLDENGNIKENFQEQMRMKNNQGQGAGQGMGQGKGMHNGTGMNQNQGQGQGARGSGKSETGAMGQGAGKGMMNQQSMRFKCTICEDDDKMMNQNRREVRLSNGKTIALKVTPEEASRRAMSRLRINCSEDNPCDVELRESKVGGESRATYQVKARKEARLFGLFKTEMSLETDIDAESGEVISVKKPWWSFLASED